MMKSEKTSALPSLLGALALAGVCAVGCTINEVDPATPTGTPDGGSSSAADAGDGRTTTGGGGCDFGEPNDTREQAKAIDVNTSYKGLCVSNPTGPDELDFFVFTAPASDNAGGFVEVTVSNVQNQGIAEIIVTSVEDNGVIFDSYTTDAGANVTGWLTVTPGAKYRIQVNRFGGKGDRFAYDLVAKYTAIVDTFEPNDTKEQAKAIEVKKPISASAAVSSAKTDATEDDDADFYKVTLGAGAASVKMTQVPADYMCDVELIDAAGERVGEKYQTDKGADCVLDVVDLAGGSYFVKVHTFGGVSDRGGPGAEVPAYVRQQYSLDVVQ